MKTSRNQDSSTIVKGILLGITWYLICALKKSSKGNNHACKHHKLQAVNYKADKWVFRLLTMVQSLQNKFGVILLRMPNSAPFATRAQIGQNCQKWSIGVTYRLPRWLRCILVVKFPYCQIARHLAVSGNWQFQMADLIYGLNGC